MANKEQLAILKQGAAVWNKWRAENQGKEIDLSKLTSFPMEVYRGLLVQFIPPVEYTIDVSGYDLSGVNLSGSMQGKIPEVFLRGCGLSDWEIETVKLYNPDLSNEQITNVQYRMYELRATQAIQISRIFISYSHADGEFVDKLGKCFDEKGMRYWRDTHDMKAGPIEKQIDKAIELNPTVLLILSRHSLESDWVEHEVRKARTLEKRSKHHVLCPVALDTSWKKKNLWPERIMEQVTEYNILDFSQWKDDSKFSETFCKLIDGLQLFYKK